MDCSRVNKLVWNESSMMGTNLALVVDHTKVLAEFKHFYDHDWSSVLIPVAALLSLLIESRKA